MPNTVYLNLDKTNGKVDIMQRDSSPAETRHYTLVKGIGYEAAEALCGAVVDTSTVELFEQKKSYELEQEIEKLKRTNPEALLAAAQSLIKEGGKD